MMICGVLVMYMKSLLIGGTVLHVSQLSQTSLCLSRHVQRVSLTVSAGPEGVLGCLDVSRCV
jgi:hypothetical protein